MSNASAIDPVGGVCDGDPDMRYTPSGTPTGAMAEGYCREVMAAASAAATAVGRTAKECAEETAVGAGAEFVSSKGSLWSRAKKLGKKLPGRAFAVTTAIACVHDIVD